MVRTVFAFVFGVVFGIAVIHVLDGPLNYNLIRREAGEVLDDASRGAHQLRLGASVRAALALQKDFDLIGGIQVEVDESDVTLRGTVASADQRKLAELIARGVEGVEGVDNRLEIERGS